MGIVGVGAEVAVDQVALEGAVHEDRKLAGRGRDGLGFPIRAAKRR